MTQMCLSLDSDLVWPFYTFLNKPHMKKSVRNGPSETIGTQ